MTSKEFIKSIEKTGYKVVNEFQNEHGEPYVIVTHKWIKGYFIAGSETDWEILRLAKTGKYAYSEFTFNEKEAATIKKVMELADKIK